MKRVKSLLILGDGRRSKIRKFSEHILSLVKPLVPQVRMELDTAKSLARVKADCVVILGGDGAILSAATRMGKNQIPCIGIQMGRFGFLSELTPEDCETSLKRIIMGKGRVRDRMMLSCRVRKGKETLFQGLALNDAFVGSLSPARMVMMALKIDNDYVSTFHGDGVVVSTPVGSTAHSLSAGGPIVEPCMRAFVITPVCSHALTIRPLVVMDDKTIKLKQDGSRHSLCLTLDGQRLHKLKSGEEVVIKTAPVSFQLIRLVDRSYFETLRKKFHWGGSLFNHSQSDSGSPRHGKSDT